MTLQERTKIAQENLSKLENSRKYFVERYEETGERLYKEMAIETGKDIGELMIAIGEALVQLEITKTNLRK